MSAIPPAGPGVSAANALRQWEAENNVKSTSDEFFHVDKPKMDKLGSERPWRENPRYFDTVHISSLALLKIVMHAQTGQGQQGLISVAGDKNNWVEVMGLLQGYFRENTFVITDSFGLPVDASEVEATMNDRSQLYMINYLQSSEELGKKEKCVGWYHSHPGYTCFLSGIDVNTQTINQTHQDPWLAIVVDPVRTISTGRVEIKAFRTFPEKYVPSEHATHNSATGGLNRDERDTIPQSKIAEFGVYMDRYYELPLHVFRSETDAAELNLLWNKYWTKTLSSSPLLTNKFFLDEQLKLVAGKMDQATASGTAVFGGGGGSLTGFSAASAAKKRAAAGRSAGGNTVDGGGQPNTAGAGGDSALDSAMNVVMRYNADVMQGMLTTMTKQQVFNNPSL